MPPCTPQLIEIGPNLFTFGIQALILAGTIFGLYRAAANANVQIAQHAERLINGSVPEAIKIAGAAIPPKEPTP